MRTVTFSTPQIQNAIANDFVALNSNIEGDPLAGESVGHAPMSNPETVSVATDDKTCRRFF